MFFGRATALQCLILAQLSCCSQKSDWIQAFLLLYNLIIHILLKFFPKKDLHLKFCFFVFKEGYKTGSHFRLDPGPQALLYVLRSSQVGFLCPSSAVLGTFYSCHWEGPGSILASADSVEIPGMPLLFSNPTEKRGPPRVAKSVTWLLLAGPQRISSSLATACNLVLSPVLLRMDKFRLPASML